VVQFLENGVAVDQRTVQVPPLAGGATLLVTVPDLTGQDPPPPAQRVLRGTVSQLVPFGPGGDPAAGRVPYAGAVVVVGSGSQARRSMADGQGAYAFTNLSCPGNTCQVTVQSPTGTTLINATGVALGPSQSTTVRDFTAGPANLRDLLFLAGRAVPPLTFPGDPPPPDPATVVIRVFRGTTSSSNLLVDSSVVFGGPGALGAWQLQIGRVGGTSLRVGDNLVVQFLENGVAVDQRTVQVPPLAGGATLLVTVPDLTGQ
jgi:hypothetical protein